MTALAYGALADAHANCAPSDVYPGPRFAGSSDVGGANADWIAGGLLVDVKATATSKRQRRQRSSRTTAGDSAGLGSTGSRRSCSTR